MRPTLSVPSRARQTPALETDRYSPNVLTEWCCLVGQTKTCEPPLRACLALFLPPLLEMVQKKKIDQSCIITHRGPLSRAPEACAMFADKTDGCIKVALDPTR